MKRCLEAPVAILGVLKAGGGWVPLDPAYPIARLEYMIEDSGVSLVLSQPELVELVRTAAQVECVPLDLDDTIPEVRGQRSANPIVKGLRPENLAYVIYTSGTTGRPRGVLVPHRGVVNVVWYQAFKLLGPGTVRSTVLHASLSFDASVVVLFLPLAAGGTVCIVSDLEELGRLLAVDGVTYLLLTPSTLDALMTNASVPDDIDTIAVGGEAVSRQLVERVRSRTSVARMINSYGPTEASIACADGALFDRRSEPSDHGAGRPIDTRRGPVTIGRAMPNMPSYVLDTNLEPVPVGVTGELHVGGIGLARGYLNQSAVTGEKFIPDPFSSEPGARMYKTGDLARYCPDGRIEFLGRRDHQVKVRGFRIELGAIETVLAAHPGVRHAVAVAVRGKPSQPLAVAAGRRLVAYIVPATETPVTVTELRRHLGRELPDYMIPSAFVTLAEVPMTPSGKVDRGALPAPDLGRPDLEAVYVAPRTPVEAALAQIWRELMGLERIGVHDDFFELGGHSLLATRVVSRIRNALRVELPLRRIFEAPTIAQLATVMERHAEAAGSVSSKIERVSREGRRM
jgi:amino acid adenylation domain-containing protein